MARIDERTDRLIAEFDDAVTAIGPSGQPWLPDLLPQLLRLIGADVSVAYRVEDFPSGLALEFCYSAGMPEAMLKSSLEGLIQSKGGQYAAFNPICPEPSQRNVALANDDIRRISGVDPRTTSTYRELLPRWGMEGFDQLRVLVCEGRSMLAWVGGLRADAFSDRDRMVLDRCVPALRQRLLLERHAMANRLTSAAIPALLEVLPGPAFIVSVQGHVLESNSAGRTWLQIDRAAHAAQVCEAIRRRNPQVPFSRLRLKLGPEQTAYLVWQRGAAARSSNGALNGAATAGGSWGLTRRQQQVLELLARGLSNKSIAAELGCAVKTAEVHVSAILRRAGVPSRAALISRILSGKAG